ncbi:MAG: sugar ABC transporter substrate-binding protein [Actinobacteria bacterium]|nr:sugar ABC transporter substrate-binding protein [Actinomycetota bacterium]
MSRKKMRTLALMLAACALAVVVAACGSSSSTTSSQTTTEETSGAEEAGGGGGETEATSIVVGHVSPNLSNPTLGALNLGQQKAAAELGWKVRTLDAALSPEKQVTNLETLLNLKVNAITTWTLDPGAVEGSYKQINDAKVPLVGFNSKSSFINTNVETELSSSCKSFEAEAAYIAERIPGAKVLIVGPPPVPPLEMRQHCFETAAKKEGLSVIESQDNLEDTSSKSQVLVQSMLTAHSDAQAIWSYNDPSALGASAALQAVGKPIWSGEKEGVIVVGNNGEPNAITALKEGTLTLTYDENTFEAGVEAINALEPVLKEGKPVSSMPKKIWVKSTMYDAENVGKYVPPSQRPVELSN